MVSAPHSFFSSEEIFSASRTKVDQRATVFPPRLQVPLLALATGISYYLGTELGYLFTPSNSPIGTLWPPNAILLAILLLAPTRIWPFLLLGVVPAHLVAQLRNAVPLSSAVGWFFGNASEAVIGAACVRLFAREKPLFGSLRGTAGFLLFGVLLAPLITSFLDAAVVVLTGRANSYWMPWTSRLSSNMLSELIFVPIVVLLGRRGISLIRTVSLRRLGEGILIISGSAIVTWIVFGGQNLASRMPALICAPLPLLFWAALRFDEGVLSTSLFMIALISLWSVMNGRGPLPQASLAENVILLHFFYIGSSVPLLLLLGHEVEQRRALTTLTSTRSRLISWEERERHRVSRELHNNIAQRLALIAVEADRWRSGTGVAPEDVRKLYGEVVQISQRTRDLANEIHPFILEYADLGAGLKSLSRRMAQQSGVEIQFTESNVQSYANLGPDISLCLYRVAHKALENVVACRRAGKITIDLAITKQNAVLRIATDSVGISTDERFSRGGGLENLRERVIAFNGNCSIDSECMNGAVITVTLPLSSQSLQRA